MAGRTYEVDKKPAKQKEKIKQDLIDHTGSLRAIACRNDINRESLRRYKNNVLSNEIAEQSVADKRDVVQHFIERIDSKVDQLEKVLRAVDRELADQDGEYDLSNAGKTTPYVRMLNDTVRTLSGIIKDVTQIQESIRETAEINARPELFIAFICQVLRDSGIQSEAVFERLRAVRTDINSRKP